MTSPEAVLLACSLLWLPLANHPFLAAALNGREAWAASTWGFGLALGVALVAIHYLLLASFAWGRAFKPVVLVMLVAAALASHFIRDFGVFLDPSMLRNAVRTDLREASELIGWRLGLTLLLAAGLPAWLLWRTELPTRSWRRALSWRLATMGIALVALVLAVLAVFQPLSSLTRNHRELRYLITPANVVWSLASVVRFDTATAATVKQPVGRDARLGPSFAGRARPAVVVLVVGETARAANWGLNGYARQTTPELAQLPVLNFRDVTSCGTDTETSLPCMFSAVGRRDYDAARIRGSENLLHVLATAGVGVTWRDNQSGCKGICDGFASQRVEQLAPPGLCEGGHCLDEGLLHDLDRWLPTLKGPQLLVLHQLGNHGPSYFRRVPPAYERFQPTCKSDELRDCTPEQIVNAYDNALLYTDHLLATLIRRLQALAPQLDSAVLYVSDHGESLGEHRLFLHGMPYAIAPDVQTKVPMVMWLSDGYRAARGLDTGCLQQRAAQPASHDHLFHTVLGLLDVQTGAREAQFDLAQGCVQPQ
jgi:lipid A ethanolaminephosphotransferase